jgi:hypothetical protein
LRINTKYLRKPKSPIAGMLAQRCATLLPCVTHNNTKYIFLENVQLAYL